MFVRHVGREKYAHCGAAVGDVRRKGLSQGGEYGYLTRPMGWLRRPLTFYTSY